MEIDKTDVENVTKFLYLEKMVMPKVALMMDGPPFDSKGYERTENI